MPKKTHTQFIYVLRYNKITAGICFSIFFLNLKLHVEVLFDNKKTAILLKV